MRIEVTYVLSFVDISFAAQLGNIQVIEKCEGVLMTASHHQGYRFVCITQTLSWIYQSTMATKLTE